MCSTLDGVTSAKHVQLLFGALVLPVFCLLSICMTYVCRYLILLAACGHTATLFSTHPQSRLHATANCLDATVSTDRMHNVWEEAAH